MHHGVPLKPFIEMLTKVKFVIKLLCLFDGIFFLWKRVQKYKMATKILNDLLESNFYKELEREN